MTRVAAYARVSAANQVRQQTIGQQLGRLRPHPQAQGAAPGDALVFRDGGYSGAQLNRPGLAACGMPSANAGLTACC